MGEQLRTMQEVAGEIRISLDTLRWWRTVGRGPKGFRVGKRVLYYQSEVDRWVEEQRRADAATPPSPAELSRPRESRRPPDGGDEPRDGTGRSASGK